MRQSEAAQPVDGHACVAAPRWGLHQRLDGEPGKRPVERTGLGDREFERQGASLSGVTSPASGGVKMLAWGFCQMIRCVTSLPGGSSRAGWVGSLAMEIFCCSPGGGVPRLAFRCPPLGDREREHSRQTWRQDISASVPPCAHHPPPKKFYTHPICSTRSAKAARTFMDLAAFFFVWAMTRTCHSSARVLYGSKIS